MNPIDDDRLTTAGLLFEAYAGLVAVLQRRLEADFGLSVQWFEVLLRLARTPERRLRMSDLAAQTALTKSGLTRVVDRLVEAGLVRREECPTDARATFAVLTPKGRQRVEAAVCDHLEALQEHMIGLLTPAERRALDSGLRKVRDHVRPESVRGADCSH
jgi:DNA-binding MarR family transcriptional regulator